MSHVIKNYSFTLGGLRYDTSYSFQVYPVVTSQQMETVVKTGLVSVVTQVRGLDSELQD